MHIRFLKQGQPDALKRGLQAFSVKGADNKYFSLCGPHGLCRSC